MTPEDMKSRTFQYGIRAIRLADALPQNRSAELNARRLIQHGTSVGANYRAACRAQSARDFVAKLGIVEEEADEALYWMEILVETGLMKASRPAASRKEGNEIIAIIIASIRSAREKARR
ncbi:MAG: four helix bundle protein [Phycisphaerae bacterium]